MQRWMLVAGLAVISGVNTGSAAAQAEADVTVRAFRFYRAEAKQTLVTAFVEVPYRIFAPTDSTPGAELKYGVVVTIQDANGVRLNEATWPGRARAELRTARAMAVEMLDFSLAPGAFRITVDVTDSVSGQKFTGTTDVVAWGAPPRTSDLLLSPAMRLASGGDTMPQRGERPWGNTFVTATNRLRLTPVRSRAFYLLEAYTAQSDSGTMSVRVTDSTGRVLVSSRPQMVRVTAPGSVLKGQLDLAGLPQGQYNLTVKLALGQSTEELTDRFIMADFQETMQKEKVVLDAMRETDEGYFGLMNEAELDEAEAPLIYLVTSDSLSVWKAGLSLQAKRQFLTRFWQGRDPSPTNPRNERREAFYGEIERVNQQYKESGRAARLGWKTDRGRIRIRNGLPADVLDRRTSLGKAPPYEVWRYSSGKERYYIFADRTGFGNYELVATNDLRESSRAGFQDLLGPDALQDISRYLNIDFFRGEATVAPTQQQ